MDRRARKSHSPSRQRWSALSPLQAFSPLTPETPLDSHPGAAPRPSRSRSSSSSSLTSAYSAGGGLRRSVSGRDRVLPRRDDYYPGDEYPSGITTRLILVKAPQSPRQENNTPLRQRSKSSSNLHPISTTIPASSDAPATSPRRPRRSFAAASFSSFASMTSLNSDDNGNTTPSDSDQLTRRPSSNSLSLSTGPTGPTQGTMGPGLSRTLSPEEVLELARGLMQPVAAPEPGESPRPASLTRRKSTGSSVSRGMASQKTEPIELEPVDYVQMDEDTLLPFSDRPTQVAELLHNPLNADMFSLIEHVFPKGKVRENWRDIDVTKWTWDEFLLHLTTVKRAECPDYPWVLLARTAVRAHSVAAWEKLGACLGCDSELITAGDEDEGPTSWGGLGLGDEGEVDPAHSRVHIEALEAVDPLELEKNERMFAMEFGEPVEGDVLGLAESPTMATIGEREEPSSGSGSGSSGSGSGPGSILTSATQSSIDIPSKGPRSPLTSKIDPHPFISPVSPRGRGYSGGSSSAISDRSVSPTSPRDARAMRSRSFVGLQIMTTTEPSPNSPRMRSPRSSQEYLPSPATPGTPVSPPMVATQYERTPGNPLFVSSFNTLSLGPNLGRRASTGFAPPAAGGPSSDLVRQYNRRTMPRKASATGLSESAITFVSDSSGF